MPIKTPAGLFKTDVDKMILQFIWKTVLKKNKGGLMLCGFRNFHPLLVGTKTGAATLGNSLEGFDKVSPTLARGPSNSSPRRLPKRDEDTRLCKDTYVKVHTPGIIPNCEQPKCPPTGR